jgi:endonuclease YncB( thermonuclease family)
VRWPVVLALALPLLAGCGGKAKPSADLALWTDTATFVSAPDGDTLKVKTAGHGETSIRVAGVDCPERGQAYWRVAKDHLVDFASKGELAVACYKTDQYGRHVCRVKRGNEDLGASLVQAGLAWHYKRFENEQTADERALYAKLEQAAREKRAGLWQEPTPMPPEVCRKARRAGETCR